MAVLSLLVSGTAWLRRQEKFREFLRVQNCAWQALFPLMENNLRKTSVPRYQRMMTPVRGLWNRSVHHRGSQPSAALHREQVRSPVLCESPPPKREASHRFYDSTSCLC